MDYKVLFNISAIENIYREVSQPAPPKSLPKASATPSPIRLERADVDDILTHKRNATIEELEEIIERSKELQLTTWQRNQIGVELSIALAHRSRRKADPATEFLSVLHVVETPRGLLHDYEWVQQEMRAGAQAIASCKLHRPPRCSCWREARERIWRIQDYCGSDSAEAWATEQMWNMFEEMELASRPERATGLGVAPQQIPQGFE
jgi:hypothetical protein